MYPSGRWKAYWDQPGYGRQEMELYLHFENGLISGQGADCIGLFTYEGKYNDQGSVVLIKQYLKAHAVLYRGQYNGEGIIEGRWSIGEYYSGGFAMTPWPEERNQDFKDNDIQSI